MMPQERIDRSWMMAHGAFAFSGHVKMQGASQYARKVIDKRDGRAIGLACTDVVYKLTKGDGARGGTTERVWWVDGHADEIPTLAEALDILALQRFAAPSTAERA